MTRETKEITVSAHTIVAYTYVTNPERDKAKQALFAGVSITPPEAGEMPGKPDIPMVNTLQFERAMIGTVLVSIDGNTNAMGVLDELPSDEYDAIVAELKTQLPRVFLVKSKS